ncbi:MAG: carboxynorspermidine decarboxylase [Helicobacteraceae bacterium]|jgi:carboxynorspermidine decarboxylase|nr:carboxynorspermidine decarboxylase [Helicobacteraceae bacterium]
MTSVSPAYVLEERKLVKNLELLARVQSISGAKILVALKGYALWDSFKLIGEYLSGAAASGLYEAKLAREEMNKEVHVFCPAITDETIDEIAALSDYLIFNSFSQLAMFKDRAKAVNPKLQIGARVNPKYSEIASEIYNPCVVGSRLGVTLERFDERYLDALDGLHFHALCEQNSDALERTLVYFERDFGKYLSRMKWVNMGGGHHITRADYDVPKLIDLIGRFSDRYKTRVHLEPGEAIGWQTGYLRCRVADIVENEITTAILDVSAAAHMPDCLEAPYRPDVRGAGTPSEKKHTYRLGGPTCLAGDIIGDYSFDRELQIGDQIIFEDMIHYTMVKNNTFNGAPLPSIEKIDLNGKTRVVKEFGYLDYKNRLS